jgi:hypothetical protein
MKDNLELVNIAHHRNGAGGEPFYVILFRDLDVEMPPGTEKTPWGWSPPLMVAIACDTVGHVAVLNTKQTLMGNIDFAKGNSWRGDTYEHSLRLIIAGYEEQRQ